MSNYLGILHGVRGRSILLYDNKCEIKTTSTVGTVLTSNLTSNASDSIKTIYYTDCIGVLFKKAGMKIGYLELETPGLRQHSGGSQYSENTFTFEETDVLSNELMQEVYTYVTERIEGYKYGDQQLLTKPIPAMMAAKFKKPIFSDYEEQSALKQKREEEHEALKAAQGNLDDILAEVNREYEELFEEYGIEASVNSLSDMEKTIIKSVAENDKETSVSEIARMMPRTVTPVEVTEILDGLVAKGVMKKVEGDVYRL
ncbi:MAG: hypothetical protein IJZ42_02895 [Lachnospiraceae bacterium]|nr:hypothetical protein [Lachnospiraceae bacterium]